MTNPQPEVAVGTENKSSNNSGFLRAIVPIIASVGVLGGGLGGIIYLVNRAVTEGKERARIENEFVQSYKEIASVLGEDFTKYPEVFRLAKDKFSSNPFILMVEGNDSLTLGLNSRDSIVRKRYLEDATSYFTELVGMKDTYGGNFGLGRALARLGRFETAEPYLVSAYNKASAETSVLDGQRFDASIWLAYVNFAERDAKELSQYAEECIERAEGDEVVYCHTYNGIALLWKGDKEKAKEELTASTSELEHKVTEDSHEEWVRARHFLMGYHGLALLGDAESGDREHSLSEQFIARQTISQEDFDRIITNNPPL